MTLYSNPGLGVIQYSCYVIQDHKVSVDKPQGAIYNNEISDNHKPKLATSRGLHSIRAYLNLMAFINQQW